MTDRPILFSAPMIRALMEGRKTQTRRIVMTGAEIARGPFELVRFRSGDVAGWQVGLRKFNNWKSLKVRYQTGDRLWVREAWRVGAMNDDKAPSEMIPRHMTTLYEAGGSQAGDSAPPKDRPRAPADYKVDAWPPAGQMPDWAGRRRVGMHMPRWASRLTLLVSDVRVQRLQDISRDDAIAEGIERAADGTFRDYRGPHVCGGWLITPQLSFETLWGSINGPKSWASNPWVVALTFSVHQQNIDTMEKAA